MSKKINLELHAKTVKALLGQDNNIKELNGVDSVAIAENDILVYKPKDNKQFYFYKALKGGTIKIPSEEYCEKLQLGEGYSSYKKKSKK